MSESLDLKSTLRVDDLFPPSQSGRPRYRIEESTGCWLWLGSLALKGYGQISIGGVTRLAHRYSYEHSRGPTDGLCVLHHCDNRACVNPAHLFLGSCLDNTQDCVSKDRQAKGPRIGSAKVTEADVVAMRENWAIGRSMSSLSREYGISLSTVSDIVHRRGWRHVPENSDCKGYREGLEVSEGDGTN